VSGRALFTGHALNAIDAKGRVAIPAGLRQSIEANGDGRNLIIAKHETDACLIGYDRGWSQLLHARLNKSEDRAAEAGRDYDRHNSNRRAFGLVEDVPYDASGRFVLPPMLHDRAKLEDLALFLGTGDTFEIWNPRLLIDAPQMDEELKDVARWLLRSRGVA
jgi:MraZ protein